ncbi:DUF3558 domain-containing protein [Saccharopolyspora sp. 5N708]
MAGALFASLLLSGCAGNGDGTEPPQTSASAESSTLETSSARTGPAKSLDLSDACSIVTEAQWKELGGDQPPNARESNGKPGCNYEAGESGSDGGWNVFVAADTARNLKQFVDTSPNAETTEVAGYPAAQVGTTGTNCIVVVDVADQGSLFINGLTRSTNPNPCDLSKQFAEAAIQNLPDA